jgi:hypothetical protein
VYDLNAVRPALFESKVRLGKDSDGGYVLTAGQVGATRTLLSFGVATDWSFEEDFFRRRPGLAVRMFDHSISFPLILVKLASKLAKLDFRKARHYAEASLRYVSFIVLNDSVAFHRKFLGLRDTPRDVSFGSVLRLLGGAPPAPGSVFVKLDIEGGEYDLLPEIARHADAINGMAIEFHDLGRMGGRMEEAMRMLGERFAVAHVHGNNFTGLVPGTALPLSLEVTLVNRALAGAGLRPDPGPFPRPGLDHPNDPAKGDYQLNFS